MDRKQMIERQRAILAAAQQQNRDLTAEEQTEFDTLQRSIDALDAAEAAGTQRQQAAAQQPEGQQAETRTAESQTNSETTREVVQRAIEAERGRIRSITELCRSFALNPDEFLGTDKPNTLEQARSLVLERLQKTGAPVGVAVTKDEGDKFRDAASDALMIRSGVVLDKPAEGATDLRAMSLKDLAVESFAREGRDVHELIRMSADELYDKLTRDFYNPSAAFPAILDNSIKKSIVTLYNQVPTTFQIWTTKGSLSDFKETKDHEYVIGGVGDFEKVAENGEIKAVIPKTELLPSRKLETYGKSFSMTRQAFINDDIGFVSRVPGLYATKAKMTVDKLVYKVIFENGKIFDGKNLFSADHANITTPAAKPTQQSLQAAILQMQLQKDQFGEAIYVNPRYIVVPTGYQFDIEVILKSAQVPGSSNNDYNPMQNYPIQVIQSPQINALAKTNAAPWFMVADPMSAKSIQVDYLNGNETPTVRRMEAPGVLGYTWDMYFDAGIAVRDYRGIVKNDGVKM